MPTLQDLIYQRSPFAPGASPFETDNPISLLDSIQRSTNPYGFGSSYLDLLSNNDRLSAAVNAGGLNALGLGGQTLINDLFGRGSFRSGEYDPFGYQSDLGQGLPERGRAATREEALGGVRDVQLGVDPLRRTELQNRFLGDSLAQGAITGLRDRGLGQDLNLTATQSSFNRLGSNQRNQIAGRAAAFGLDSDQLQRGILGNTLRGRGGNAAGGYNRRR